MADNLNGKVWQLDTVAGLVTQNPVIIHAIHIRWTTAGIGSFQLSTANSTGDLLLDLKTTAASTAAVFGLTERYTFGNQTFQGLRKVISVNVDTIHIVTCTQS